MDDEEKEWYKQFSASFGAEEFIRFGCAFVLWQLTGFGLMLWLRNVGIMMIFLAPVFLFPTLVTRLQPAYSLFRKITGNPKMPNGLMPGTRKWYFYISPIIQLLISAILIYQGMQLLRR